MLAIRYEGEFWLCKPTLAEREGVFAIPFGRFNFSRYGTGYSAGSGSG
jgi:hypothetical protein